MDLVSHVALGFVLGLAFSWTIGLRLLKTAFNTSSVVRDQWVKTLFNAATADEVQRWKRGEFL
jgi:hypothetical protein